MALNYNQKLYSIVDYTLDNNYNVCVCVWTTFRIINGCLLLYFGCAC